MHAHECVHPSYPWLRNEQRVVVSQASKLGPIPGDAGEVEKRVVRDQIEINATEDPELNLTVTREMQMKNHDDMPFSSYQMGGSSRSASVTCREGCAIAGTPVHYQWKCRRIGPGWKTASQQLGLA